MSAAVLRAARVALPQSQLRAQLNHLAPRARSFAYAAPSRSRNVLNDAFDVYCIRFHDLFTLSVPPRAPIAPQFATLSPLLSRGTRLACIGDALLVLRGNVRAAVVRRMGRFTATSGRYARAALGMAGAASVAAERRSHAAATEQQLARVITTVPRGVGVGWFSPFWRRVLALSTVVLITAGAVFVAVSSVHGFVTVLLGGMLCFATRPDLNSFVAWVSERAPELAKRKTRFVDRVRVRVTPYLLAIRTPLLYDFGLFSLLLCTDHERFVYVYAGCLSRWCLLGWYNDAHELQPLVNS